MSTDVESGQQSLEFEGGESIDEFGGPDAVFGTADFDDERPLRPIDWNTLTADEALVEWKDLDKFVKWLRLSYGLPPAVVPPLWHRHDELIWELSALHTARVNAYDPEASPSAPLAWHRELRECQQRLREWVSLSGTRLDRDRPTRQTAWPGEPPYDPAPEVEIVDRDADFAAFVAEDIAARRAIEAALGFAS
jgi:hypothetical protein